MLANTSSIAVLGLFTVCLGLYKTNNLANFNMRDEISFLMLKSFCEIKCITDLHVFR